MADWNASPQHTHRSSSLEGSRPSCWAALVPKVWEELRCRECDEFTAKRLILLGRSEGKQKKSSDILHENIQDVLVDASMACKSIDIFGDGSWTCLRKSSGCSLAVDSGRRLVLIGGPANRNLSLPSNDFGRAIRVGHFVHRPSLQACPPRPSPTFQRTSLPSFGGFKTPSQFESASDIRYSLLPFLGNEKNSNHNADSLLTMGHPIRHISRIQPRFLCQGDTPNLRRPGPTPPVMGPALTGRGIPEPQSSLIRAWHQKPCSGVVTLGGTPP